MGNNFNFSGFNSLILIITAALIFSCSQPDENGGTPNLESNLPFGISVLAEKNEAVYQIDILGSPEEKEVINLSQTTGVPADFREVHINGSKFTFFKKVGGNYAFWQKDVITGNSLNRSPMCEPVIEGSWSTPETNGDKLALVLVFYNENYQWENYFSVYNPVSDSCSRFNIPNINVQFGVDAHLHKERLYLYTTEVYGTQYSLTVIDSNNGELVKKLNFGTPFQTRMSEENLYILLPNGNFKMYNLNDLSLNEEGVTGNQTIFGTPGIIKTSFNGNKMVFEYPYPQPSLYESGPAIYDWDTKEITHGGNLYIADAINELQTQTGKNLAYTTLNVDLNSKIVVAGYKNLEESDKGGVIYFNFEGKLLKDIPLDYAPFKIMIRE